MFPIEAFIQPGEFERAALVRERDALWRDRNHLSADQGKRLDTLLARLGRPDQPSNQLKNFSQFVNPSARQGELQSPADRQGFEPFDYSERS